VTLTWFAGRVTINVFGGHLCFSVKEIIFYNSLFYFLDKSCLSHDRLIAFCIVNPYLKITWNIFALNSYLVRIQTSQNC
jgi:hypothetical protein